MKEAKQKIEYTYSDNFTVLSANMLNEFLTVENDITIPAQISILVDVLGAMRTQYTTQLTVTATTPWIERG